jgi:transcriptional regulator with XRE-family HTH domain
MDDLKFGAAIRAARIRRGWRQRDLATRAGLSRGTVGRIELGRLEELTLGTIRRVARILEIGAELNPRTRGAALDRILAARHAALAEAVVAWFARIDGWVVRPEVSFSIWGERGVVDLLGWHAATATLLVIELKTAIVDVGDILATFDRKIRLARNIAVELGWQAASVAACLVIGDGMTNRRRIADHAATFRAAFPDDGRRLHGWLARPVGSVRALTFVSDARPGSLRSGFATPARVSTRSSGKPRRVRTRAEHESGASNGGSEQARGHTAAVSPSPSSKMV